MRGLRRGALVNGYTWAERKRRRAVVEAHVVRHGLWCPGWGVPPHPVKRFSELSADHVVPVFYGGQAGPIEVRCLGCNTRRRSMPRGGRRG
jgi:5-methylcytosine-specific restriction protein A